MSPVSAEQVLEPIETVVTLSGTSELVPSSLDDAAPWLYWALAQLHDLERTGRDYPGVGDLRVTEAAANRIRMLLSNVSVRNLPAPVVYPISGRGAGMRWVLGRREVEFTVFAGGETVMAKLEGGELVEDIELTDRIPENVNEYLGWITATR